MSEDGQEQQEGMDKDWSVLQIKPELQRKGNWENMTAIRDVVSASDVLKKGLPVYYPGAREDLIYALGMTDASSFVFVDPSYLNEEGQEIPMFSPTIEAEKIGATNITTRTEGVLGKGGKKIIEFVFQGRKRKVTLYAEDATTFKAPELADGAAMSIIRGLDPIMETGAQAAAGDSIEPTFFINYLQSVAEGGFINILPSITTSPETIGFKKVIEPKKNERGQEMGHVLFQKQRVVDTLPSQVTADVRQVYSV